MHSVLHRLLRGFPFWGWLRNCQFLGVQLSGDTSSAQSGTVSLAHLAGSSLLPLIESPAAQHAGATAQRAGDSGLTLPTLMPLEATLQAPAAQRTRIHGVPRSHSTGAVSSFVHAGANAESALDCGVHRGATHGVHVKEIGFGRKLPRSATMHVICQTPM